jgi:5'(3')-deoxyribonucleotidase
MITIAFDVDGVLADLCTAWLNKYNKDYKDTLTPYDITEWDTAKFVKPECGNKIFEYLVPKLWKSVKPIDGGIECVQFARKNDYRVIFVTSVYKEAGAKYDWLMEHSFFDGIAKPKMDYYEGSDKSLICADMLVDDGLHNLKTFKGFPLVFDQPWNRPTVGYERAVGFDDVTRYIMAQPWVSSIARR